MTLMTFCNPRIQKNTKKATKVARQTLTAYIIEADKEVNLCDCLLKICQKLLNTHFV
jgi:hypothetical protein